ncbi:MAG: hypothetical protein CVU65_13490 [Deltaproteobacteria bacterium HGW-Deltaproteobacteria-22]|nr:MAG: hypothetical protein CVU65_13490 [Deltaproteobacteria bacterium HGW-Deltaproteobacteria-22]
MKGLWLFFLFFPTLAGCTGADPKPGSQPTDCSQIPAAPLEINELAAPRGSKDLAFDKFGYVTGFDGFSLVRANLAGDTQVLTTADFGGEGPDGLEYLPDGRLLGASQNQGVFTVTPDGAINSLLPDLREVFGLLQGPDGMIYAGDNANIYRINPQTGASAVLLRGQDYPELGEFRPRIVNFTLDYSTMIIGTHENQLFRVPIDADLNPAGDPVFWLDVAGSFSGVDGLVVDVCGNFYVPSYPDELYRITPDGVAHLYHKWSGPETFGHGVRWGTGRYGWRDDALYLPRPYGDFRVVEVVTGVPGRQAPEPQRGDAHLLSCRAGSPGSRASGPCSETPSLPPLWPAGLLFLSTLWRWRRREHGVDE